MADYDVAVVGASIAGSVAATLLGRAGVRVALVEQHRNPGAFKVLCTHHVMASGSPTIRRLGLDAAIEWAGGIRNALDVYLPWGWVLSPPGVPHGYSIRREKLDPMVRALAAGTPGVDLLAGLRIVGLLPGADGAAVGVRLRGRDRAERDVTARLVVGADGAHSTVAALTAARSRVTPNARFMYFAEYTDVTLTSGTHTQVWQHEESICYAMPNDDGRTVLASMPVKGELADYRADLEGSLVRALRRLPDAPEFDPRRRVSPVVGTPDYPLVTRPAVPTPGVALVGDAALTSDPSQGVGCGRAFQSAEWLAEAVASPLVDGAPLGPALRRYAAQRADLLAHQTQIEQEAILIPPTEEDLLRLEAAVDDPIEATHLAALINRLITPTQYRELARTAVQGIPGEESRN